MVGLARGDLFLRGSRLWSCGKCGFPRNFTNRCKCLECHERPPQWILDAQSAKVKELAKAPAKAEHEGGRGAKSKPPTANQGKSDLEREVERLRAENSRLKQGSTTPEAKDTREDAQGGEADDAEYQATLDDLEGQLAGLRRLARESRDPSHISAWIENLEKKAEAVRAERRSGWSVSRLLDRQRSRVVERESRVAKAQAKVDELQEAKARICEELEEAAAHLAAKQEDLNSEKMECERLERQLPAAGVRDTAAPEQTRPTIDLEAPDAEEMAVAVLRRMSARQGGAWAHLLEAVAPTGPAAAAAGAAAAAALPKDKETHQEDKDAKMEVDGGQNAIVPTRACLEPSPTSGKTLALVPAIHGKRVQSGASASDAKRCK